MDDRPVGAWGEDDCPCYNHAEAAAAASGSSVQENEPPSYVIRSIHKLLETVKSVLCTGKRQTSLLLNRNIVMCADDPKDVEPLVREKEIALSYYSINSVIRFIESDSRFTVLPGQRNDRFDREGYCFVRFRHMNSSPLTVVLRFDACPVYLSPKGQFESEYMVDVFLPKETHYTEARDWMVQLMVRWLRKDAFDSGPPRICFGPVIEGETIKYFRDELFHTLKFVGFACTPVGIDSFDVMTSSHLHTFRVVRQPPLREFNGLHWFVELTRSLSLPPRGISGR